MAIGSPQWMYSSGSAYEIENSLRFNISDGAYLSSVLPSSDRQKFTISTWFKLGAISSTQAILTTGDYGAGEGFLNVFLNSAGRMTVDDYVQTGGDFYNLRWSTPAAGPLFRDPSAWYHLIISVDTTQGTQSNRVKVYINGSDISSEFTQTTSPSQNANMNINNGYEVFLGGRYNGDWDWDGYLAEVNFIDGTAELPSAFGETGTYGEWKPIEYSGTYGTNGFYLPMNQDYTVEGFSAVTYTGNGGTQYIGGTGFQPDLTWIKQRSSTQWHQLTDSIRGVGKQIFSNDTSAEDNATNKLTAFNTDGFSLDSHEGVNGSGATYVAWNWDMGSAAAHFVTAGGNAQHSTTQNKIGSSSLKFDGTGDYLSVSDPSIIFGGDNFTVEYWINFPNTPGGTEYQHIGQNDGSGLNQWRIDATSSRIEVQFSSNNVDHLNFNNSGSSQITAANTWYHIALVRNGDTVTLYLNGTSGASATWSGVDMLNIDADLFVGNWRDNTGGVNGYMDEVRISNTARYTANFTPSTVAFTDDSNTLVLIHSNTTNGSTTFTDSHGTALNTDGTITSRVKANSTYGQSVVSYTGTGTGSSPTVGHGLDSAPEFFVVKRRSSLNGAWPAQHKYDTTKYFQMQDVDAASTGINVFDNTAPTSTVFTINSTDAVVNASGHDYIAYCWHSVAGYSKIDSYSGNGSTTGPTITTGFRPAFIMIKSTALDNWFVFDTTRSAGPNPINIFLLADEPADESVTSNANIDILDTGFQLKTLHASFNGSSTTYIYMAFADKREAAFWLDASGNNNDWTPNNLTESDVSKDSPTNNFCTLNPLLYSSTARPITLSEGNLKSTNVAIVGGGGSSAVSTMGMTTGKWYAEYIFTGGTPEGGASGGIVNSDFGFGNAADDYFWRSSSGFGYDFTTGKKNNNAVQAAYGAAYAVGDIIGIAFDADNNTLTFYKNNASQGAISSIPSDTYYFAYYGYNADVIVFNFGQDSSFAGNKTAQGNQDGNSIGDFYYTPPTDFLALCTSNLPAVAVVPSEHFNTVTYTGDTSVDRDITGVGFDPSLVWIKARNYTYEQMWFDKIRGAGERLYSHSTAAESTNDSTLNAFITDGFTVGNGTSVDLSANGIGRNYVSWNWKAGGTGVSNTSGSINSTVSVNADAGFSIVSWVATGSAASVGHGLGSTPDMFILKNRDVVDHWRVNHIGLTGAADHIDLDRTNAEGTGGGTVFPSAPTSTVINVGTDQSMGNSGNAMIAYCFKSVDGYSKMGSYTGNGSTDGSFIFLGFRPAWILRKRATTTTGHWFLNDNKRDGFNGDTSNDALLPNSTTTETDAGVIDFLSNGFKVRTIDGDVNASGNTYIYLAFAEQPFKHSNAR